MSIFYKKIVFTAIIILFTVQGFAQKNQTALEKEFTRLELLADKGDYKGGLFYSKKLCNSIKKKSGSNTINLLLSNCYLAYFYDRLDQTKEVNETLNQIKDLIPLVYDDKRISETVKAYGLLSEFYYQRGVYAATEILLNYIQSHQSSLLPLEREIVNYYKLTSLYHKGFLNETSQKIESSISNIKNILNNDTIRVGEEKKFVTLTSKNKIERKNLLAKFLLLKSKVYISNGLADSSIQYLNTNQSLLKNDLPNGEGYNARIHYQLGLSYEDKHDNAKAENEFKIASSLGERYFLPHSPYLIDIKHNLIKVLLEEEKTGEAEYYNNDANVKIYGYFGNNSLPYLENTFTNIESEMYYQNWPEAEKRLVNILDSPLLPDAHSIKAKALAYLFEALTNQQKNKEAEQIMTKMLEQQQSLTGKQSPAYTMLILKKALFYSYNQNKFSESKSLFKEIFESDIRQYISIENPSYYKNMTALSSLYIYMEEFNEASTLLTNELNRIEKERSAQHPLYALYLSHLAELKISTGEYANANKQLELSLDIFEKNPNKKFSKEYIEALELKIKANVLEGDYTSAKAALSKAENVAKHIKIFTTGDLFLLEETGLLYIKTGKYQQAEKYLNNMLKVKERNLGKTHKNLYTVLLYLGHLEVVIGNYSQADTYFERASEITKTSFGAKSIPYANCLLFYKDLYLAMGDYEKTENSLKESLEIFIKTYGEKNIKSGELMHELALANFESDLYSGKKSKHKPSDIEQLFLKSLEVIKNTEGENSVFYAEALEDFAVFNAQRGQAEKALADINKARIIWDTKIGGTNENSARLYFLAGKIHYLRGKYAESLTAFEKTRDEYEKIFDDRHPSYVEALGKCAQIYYITGNTERAISSIEECTNKSMQYIDQVFPFLSERGKMAYWDKIKNDFEFYKTIAFSNSTSNPAMIGKIFNIQLQTKSILLNSLLKIKNRIYASGDTSSIRLYQEWQQTRDNLSIAYSMTAPQRKENQINIPALELSLEQIEKQLSEKSSDFAEGNNKNSSTNYTWKNIQQKLGDKEMLIEVIPFRYFTKTFSDTIWYAFVSINTKSKTPNFVVLKNGQDLETKYLKYYQSSRKFNIADQNSFDKYWKPLSPLMDPSYSTIYFSADGVYNQINPETFTDEKGEYLINTKNIISIGTGRDLLNKGENLSKKSKSTAPAPNIVMVGNPTYFADNSNINTTLSQLPGSEEEVKKIDSLLKAKGWQTKLYIGTTATEETIKSIHSPKVYHISTHGFFWKDNSGNQEDELNENNINNPLLRSGLVLYNGGTLLQTDNINSINQADGILTAYEAMNLSLDNTELVILSACETGLGEVKVGEGVYGLQRAFTVAGAHSIIMSLSKVSDAVTIQLMTNFYNIWLKNGNKRSAFLQAKQELIKTYPEPKYWGAFVMIGTD